MTRYARVMKYQVFLAAFLIPALALAEEPLPAPSIVTFPPGEDNIASVKKGEPAPYAGQLYDNDTALRWAMWLQQYKLRYGTDMQAQQESCKVQVARDGVYRAIESDRNAKSEKDLRDRLVADEKARLEVEEKLRNPPFWKEPGFWYGAGVVTTVVAVAAVAVAAHK